MNTRSIYPALIVCVLLSVASVWATGYFATQQFSMAHFVAWILGQVTIFQFYPPAFMRDFGSGVLNGGLWTITVELQFYLLVPMVYACLKRCRRLRQQNVLLLGLTLAFLAFSLWFHALDAARGDHVAVKLVRASFAPWFWMFLVGVLVQRNFDAVYRLLAGRAWLLVPLYLVASYVGVNVLGLGSGNRLDPVLYVLLSAAVFASAYSVPHLANTLLHRNDVSYGLYIYHIPVINLMMWYGWTGTWGYAMLATALATVLAILSWVIVERPAMRLKKHPLLAVAVK